MFHDVSLVLCCYYHFHFLEQGGDSAKYQVLLAQMEYVLSSRRLIRQSNVTMVRTGRLSLNSDYIYNSCFKFEHILLF